MRRKIMSSFQGDEKDILDETTSIIIRSVDDARRLSTTDEAYPYLTDKTVEDLSSYRGP
jgi:hypothetical protein